MIPLTLVLAAVLAAVLALVLAAAFAVVEGRGAESLMPHRLVRNRSLLAGVSVAIFGHLPYGYSALAARLAFLVPSLAVATGTQWAGGRRRAWARASRSWRGSSPASRAWRCWPWVGCSWAARHPAAAAPVDVPGASTSTAGVMLLVFALVQGKEISWSTR
ncbi:hypothetical protein [Actinomadura miaoliensis]|uniref:Uncharacterized protein n=1 Tax=Actinomadura miaoliensis TaxID=430685 RepID=A0ABP7W6R0_9ACTN